MNKSYLKEVTDITNTRSLGARGTVIESTIVLKEGKIQHRHCFKSVDEVYDEIIACINYQLESDSFIGAIKSISYTNAFFSKKAIALDLENMTINGVHIPKEQLVVNRRVKDVKHMRNTRDYYFKLFTFA
jgi:hypothetical protein